MKKIQVWVIGCVVMFFFSGSLFAQAPKAAMVSDKVVGDSPLTIHFTSKCVNASDLFWDFGNGNTSMLENPSNVYFKSGQYTVKLIAKGIGGKKDSIVAFNMITVLPSPLAAFDCSENSACAGASLMFTNESENASSFLWDFGDGITSTNENPSHQYNQPGLYTIKLIAYSSDGKSHIKVKEKSIEIFPEVILDFEVDSQIGCDLQNGFFV
jgi:PKD repeat protein